MRITGIRRLVRIKASAPCRHSAGPMSPTSARRCTDTECFKASLEDGGFYEGRRLCLWLRGLHASWIPVPLTPAQDPAILKAASLVLAGYYVEQSHIGGTGRPTISTECRPTTGIIGKVGLLPVAWRNLVAQCHMGIAAWWYNRSGVHILHMYIIL